MKTIKITYWTTTSALALLSIGTAYAYFMQEEMRQSFLHLGFPDYFRMELAAAKVAGAILILAPVGERYKEWTYAGFGITYLSAFNAHVMMANPLVKSVFPLIAFTLLIISYNTYHQIRIHTIVRNPQKL
ncbi:DoxX family protein [Dyadobacter fermentans]|uniref:DoxX family protein n=1 Tax=Dyadobacter fermentans TaxID=94254 RepID=UPI001CBA9A6F|nr:DoxX family protein [Dyadobacter fermentans]MBZ1357185.1 DoxX family protein [Dyadobacter fermentans]